MTDHIWHDYRNPPDSDRVIVLRFDEAGEYDVEGRYDARYGAYYRRFASSCHAFVHPVQWRELLEGKQCHG